MVYEFAKWNMFSSHKQSHNPPLQFFYRTDKEKYRSIGLSVPKKAARLLPQLYQLQGTEHSTGMNQETTAIVSASCTAPSIFFIIISS